MTMLNTIDDTKVLVDASALEGSVALSQKQREGRVGEDMTVSKCAWNDRAMISINMCGWEIYISKVDK